MTVCTVFKVLCIAALICLPANFVAADNRESVDMLLCITGDVSTSMTQTDFELQRKGHAQAISSDQVIRSIQQGQIGSIGAIYIEWAGADDQRTVVDWKKIDSSAAGELFALEILTGHGRPSTVGITSISKAVDKCLDAFATSPFQSEKHVIDIAGNGTNNDPSRAITHARTEALEAGATINALAINTTGIPDTHTHPEGGLKNYFIKNVAGGPDSFVLAANGYQEFVWMIELKFKMEIARTNGSWITTAKAP